MENRGTSSKWARATHRWHVLRLGSTHLIGGGRRRSPEVACQPEQAEALFRPQGFSSEIESIDKTAKTHNPMHAGTCGTIPAPFKTTHSATAICVEGYYTAVRVCQQPLVALEHPHAQPASEPNAPINAPMHDECSEGSFAFRSTMIHAHAYHSLRQAVEESSHKAHLQHRTCEGATASVTGANDACVIGAQGCWRVPLSLAGRLPAPACSAPRR